MAFVGQACERALSLSLSRSPLCSYLCVVDVAAVCIRAPTALVVGGVSRRSSLLQGLHSAYCGWCVFPTQGSHSACCGSRFQPFFPASGLPQPLLWIVFQPFIPASGLPQRLLWIAFPAVLPCFRASTALVVDGVCKRSSLLQGLRSAYCRWCVHPYSGLPRWCFQPFFPASRLPQLLLWIMFPAILPCFRASTALVVDSVSSRSSLLQGFHSVCCGWCLKPFLPVSGLPQRLLCVLFSTDFLCTALTMYFLSFSCSLYPVQGR